MAAHKTAFTLAVEAHECPTCHAQKGEHCVNTSTGKRTMHHQARKDLICGETFLGFPKVADGHPMFCSRRAGHKSRHRTPDGRLDWSKDYEPGPELKKILEGAA